MIAVYIIAYLIIGISVTTVVLALDKSITKNTEYTWEEYGWAVFTTICWPLVLVTFLFYSLTFLGKIPFYLVKKFK